MSSITFCAYCGGGYLRFECWCGRTFEVCDCDLGRTTCDDCEPEGTFRMEIKGDFAKFSKVDLGGVG